MSFIRALHITVTRSPESGPNTTRMAAGASVRYILLVLRHCIRTQGVKQLGCIRDRLVVLGPDWLYQGPVALGHSPGRPMPTNVYQISLDAGLAGPARQRPARPGECPVDFRGRRPGRPSSANVWQTSVDAPAGPARLMSAGFPWTLAWPAQPGECPVGGLPVDAGLAGPARRPRSQANMLSANAKFLKLACERKLEAARHLGTQSQAVLVRATNFRNRYPAPATQLKMRSSSKAINIERI